MTARRNTACLATVAVLIAAGCSDPDVTPLEASVAPTLDATTPGAEQPDPREKDLAAELARLDATLTAARTALTEAATATELGPARAAAERTVQILTAHPAWSEDLDGDGAVRTLEVTPLLPGPQEAIPEDAFYGDQFARTLTAARDAGTLGGPVVDALRDPIVGDIGVWQADAGGVLALIDTAADPTDLEAVEAALSDIPGHAAKALTYALTAVRADDLATVTRAAERATAHLDLTLASLEDLTT